ncbi:MAG: type I secretion system permease/ATPase [Thiotrichales bacterium]|nr:MAG: type I secretion system permease/ATPase [Thiotrichales bacterium]
MNTTTESSNEAISSIDDPLLACLQVVARHYGRSISRDSALAGLPLVNHRLTPALFQRAAKRATLASRLVASSLSDLTPEMLPVVLLLNGEQACVLLSLQGGQATVVYPDVPDGVVDLPVVQLQQAFAGSVIHVRPEFQFDERAPAPLNADLNQHWFWQALKQNKAIYRDILIASVFINLLAVALPMFTMNVYDRVVPNAALDTLWVLATGIVLVLVGELILKVTRSYFLDHASKRIDVDVSATIMERVLGFRLENKAASVGSFAANLRSFETVRDFLTSATLLAIVDLPFGIIFILVVAWIAPILVIPIVVGVIILLVYAWWAQARMHELSEKTYRATALRNASLIESLTGLETVKALAAEHVMQQKWESTSIYLAGINAKVKQFSATVTSGAQWVQHVIGVSIIVLGVYLIGEQALTMGGLIAVYMLSTRALAPMGQMAGLLTQYQSVKTAYQGLEDIMANSVERPDGKQFVTPSAIAGKIEFRDVAFAYPNQDQQALRGVSFSIQPGEHVAILGRNGSGKSTVLRLMLGLYQPTSGSVFIDNADLRQLDPSQVRRSAGYVQQDITLFYGSLRDNICMGRRFEDEQVLSALQLGRLKPFVDHHPKGLDMIVGERGESLSGGQRQGVAIARALVGDPSMVLMDEPTGSMDNSSEEEIKQSLKQFLNNRTFVLITHRTSLLALVDRIIVLDSGKVVADGPKEQVIEALRQGRIGKAV